MNSIHVHRLLWRLNTKIKTNVLEPHRNNGIAWILDFQSIKMRFNTYAIQHLLPFFVVVFWLSSKLDRHFLFRKSNQCWKNIDRLLIWSLFKIMFGDKKELEHNTIVWSHVELISPKRVYFSSLIVFVFISEHSHIRELRKKERNFCVGSHWMKW